jgi:hypothetical protein
MSESDGNNIVENDPDQQEGDTTTEEQTEVETAGDE